LGKFPFKGFIEIGAHKEGTPSKAHRGGLTFPERIGDPQKGETPPNRRGSKFLQLSENFGVGKRGNHYMGGGAPTRRPV